MASIALSMRFVHTWLSSPGCASIRRSVGVVVTHDGDAAAQLVPEHHERALDALGDVDRLQRRPVELRVRLHRARRAPRSASVDSFTSASSAALASVLATHSRPGSSVSPSRISRRSFAPPDVDARGGERGRDAPGAGDAAPVEPVVRAPPRDRPAPAGRGARPPDRSRAAARRSRRNCSAGSDRSASRTSDESIVSQVVCSASIVARRGRGRIVDLVREPGRERPERDQRLALARARLHVANGLEEAFDQVDAEREPLARPAHRAPAAGTRSIRPSSAARPVVRYPPSSSQARKPPAHTPGRSITFTTVSSCPVRRTSSTRPVEQHPPESAGSPSRKRIVARVERHLFADVDELGAAARR